MTFYRKHIMPLLALAWIYARPVWQLIKQLMQPSARTQTPEGALVRGLAHVVAGAALAVILPAFFAAAGYAVLKEFVVDYAWQDGDEIDGTFDAVFVAIGAYTTATDMWPMLSIALGLTHATVVYFRRNHI